MYLGNCDFFKPFLGGWKGDMKSKVRMVTLQRWKMKKGQKLNHLRGKYSYTWILIMGGKKFVIMWTFLWVQNPEHMFFQSYGVPKVFVEHFLAAKIYILEGINHIFGLGFRFLCFFGRRETFVETLQWAGFVFFPTPKSWIWYIYIVGFWDTRNSSLISDGNSQMFLRK